MAKKPRKKVAAKKTAAPKMEVMQGGRLEGPGPVVLQNDEVGRMTALSALVSRSMLSDALGKGFGTDRDYYETFGYKITLDFSDYYNIYRRQDIAGRIVDLPAQSTWRNNPLVVEDEDPNTETPFEKEWNKLCKRLRVWHILERADKLAGIGRYGCIVIGSRGGSLKSGMRKLKKESDINYLAPFGENSINIKSLVGDLKDPRYGQPEVYEIDMTASNDLDDVKSIGQPTTTAQKIEVHWTRVIHLAEGLEENFIFGKPRLERVFNIFQDLSKVVGGSAEMFWLASNRGMQFDIDADSELDSDDETALSDELKEYMHGLRRFIRTKGVTINPLTGEPIDPRGIFSVLMSLVSGATGIPQRIFMGSERGELASSQDRNNWAERIKERQQTHAEPMVLRPMVDRFIEFGALPSPGESGYIVKWPDLFAISDNERAQITTRNARAIFDFTKALDTRQDLITPGEIREMFGLPTEVPKLNRAEPPEEEDNAGAQGTAPEGADSGTGANKD